MFSTFLSYLRSQKLQSEGWRPSDHASCRHMLPLLWSKSHLDAH